MDNQINDIRLKQLVLSGKRQEFKTPDRINKNIERIFDQD